MTQTQISGDDGIEVRVNTDVHLRGFFADLKEFDPALSRSIRRRIRDAGKGIITHMRAVLDEPPPGLVVGVTKSTRVTSASSSRKRAGFNRTKREYVTEVHTSGARGRSRGSREEVKQKLRVMVSTSKTRSGIRIVGAGSPFAKSYNKKRFRHPVFGDRSNWIHQAGRPYFSNVILQHQREVEDQVWAAIDDGLEAMGKG